ncbi:2-hydroxyacid dehydrogenase [hot springs metagenome]
MLNLSSDKVKTPKISIMTTSFAIYDKSPLELLEKNKYEIILNPYGRKLKKDEIIEFCKGADGIIAGTENYDAEVLSILTQSSALSPQSSLKVISRCGTGMDNIDIDATEKLGIKVFNTPDAPTFAVAELTVGLILNLLRKVNQMDASIRNGKWEKLMGNLLSEKKVGIIGFGRIGKKVAELLKPFGCEIKYYDTRTEGEERTEDGIERNQLLKTMTQSSLLGPQSSSLDELLKTSDIISIHVSTKEQIIGEREIRMMKKASWLVNVSRGEVVDEGALYQALKEGHLSGAALDVFEQEPYNGQLKELDNVILTPHIGSYAKEARIKMELQASENLLKGLGVM